MRNLVEPVTYATTILTKELGAIPSYNTSFYCRNCHTRYHHNYHIHSVVTLRTYYPGVPRFVQASQKFFIEASMCEIFTTMMNCSWWVSHCPGRIYNQAFSPLAIKEILPSEWQPMLTCYYDDIWDSFFTYSLLLDSHTHAEVLELPHWRGTQADQLCPALEAQNERMMGIRMEQWNHGCNKCTRVFDGADGQKHRLSTLLPSPINRIFSQVPFSRWSQMVLHSACCTGELECKNLLPNSHAIYCTEHQYKAGQCAVTTCSNPVTPGCKTCADLRHRAGEDYYKLMGKAMFQLKLRLECNKVGQPHASVPEDGKSQGPDIEMVNEGAGLDDEELLV
ncbi:hypothetical protein K439DRAFT_1274843, partial [Ramaria rubella]